MCMSGCCQGDHNLVILIFVVKLDFEIAVDNKLRPMTFEGVPDAGCLPVPAGEPRPYMVNFWLNFAKSP